MKVYIGQLSLGVILTSVPVQIKYPDSWSTTSSLPSLPPSSPAVSRPASLPSAFSLVSLEGVVEADPPQQDVREEEAPEQQLDEIELEGEGEGEEAEGAPPSLFSRAAGVLGEWGVRGREMLVAGWGWGLGLVYRTGNVTSRW